LKLSVYRTISSNPGQIMRWPGNRE